MSTKDINDLLGQGELYEEAGNFEKAEALYNKVLSLSSDDLFLRQKLYKKLGGIYFKQYIKIEMGEYISSWDNIKLNAEFYVPNKPKPTCLFFHGWHMTAEDSRKAGEILPLVKDFFVVNVNMRGRAGSAGVPDASGFELLDGIDALHYAAKRWKDKIDFTRGPYVVGGSGGGGNTLALLGKAPDLFAAAVEWAGMSDYALWFKGDRKGCYRDEMSHWIAPSPEEDAAAYKSRGGLYLIENLLSPLLVMHGENDDAVPVVHSKAYEERADALNKKNIQFIWNMLGHSSMEWDKALPFLNKHQTPPELPLRGKMLVSSFLYCRNFAVKLSAPDCIGILEYDLNEQGNLLVLNFIQDASAMFSEYARIRLPFALKKNKVKISSSATLETIKENPMEGIDFIIRAKGNWTLHFTY
jgi:pimeloyl-ACP methyl ester carboxylesterase